MRARCVLTVPTEIINRDAATDLESVRSHVRSTSISRVVRGTRGWLNSAS
ncbi:Uncharacterised protein [Mycobacteroides abscessus subsp. abscessus]|nr:Uncharacterised protein [Mycobacteroides abscessus subsp. abscessus]